MERGSIIEVESDGLRYARMSKTLVFAQEGIERVCEEREREGEGRQMVMVTLTYREEESWKPVHLGEYIKCERHRLNKLGAVFAYFWVAELTRKGKVHYHILWFVPSGVRMRMPDEAGIWRHGSTRTERARNAGGYLRKYLTKWTVPGRRHYPTGLRTFGVGYSTKGMEEAKLYRQQNCVPGWLRDEVGPGVICRRSSAGGWYVGRRRYFSPYRVSVCAVDAERGKWRYYIQRVQERPYSILC